ncbi:MAG: hypothetical protein L0Z50_07160 [Verrucomicrobiales bacterium]|nr:hypothetical protein [Verrucomicrobiales bacterium]
MNSALPTLKLSLLLGAALLTAGCDLELIQAEEAVVSEKAATTDPAATSTNQATVTDGSVAPPVVEKKLSAQLQELVKMAERGLGDEVLIAWIKNSPTPFNPTPDDIVYLTDLGISEAVVRALIEHQAPNPPAAVAPVAQPINPPIGEPAPNQPALAPNAAPSVAITATPEFETAPQVTEAPPPVTYVQQPAPVQYNYFYSSLAPYGSWIEVPDYGLCWRPTVAVIDTGWRPYCHRGRWLYSNCGWYWQSDYSWGWAPFHYGRWSNHPRCGWVWSPDTVWSPAWVTWRYSDAYCGWAPLPPSCGYRSGIGLTYHSAGISVGFNFGLDRDCYTFVPTGRFHDRTPWRHALPRHQVVNVYNRTTVINNITHNSNNTLINEGPGRDQIARITRSEIQKVNIRDVPVEGSRIIKSDRLERGGKELTVYRPLNPTLPPEGSQGSLPRHEIAKTPVTTSPRDSAESQQFPGRTIGSSRSANASRLAPAKSQGTSLGTTAGGGSSERTGTLAEASPSKSAVENRRTLNHSVPVVRAPNSSAALPPNRDTASTASVLGKPSIEQRNGTIGSQAERGYTPINPTTAGGSSGVFARPAPTTATPAHGSAIISSSRPNYSQPTAASRTSVPQRDEAISKSSLANRSLGSTPSPAIRSVPSESTSRTAPQSTTTPSVYQRSPISSRGTISSPAPPVTPNSQRSYQTPSRPIPSSATPAYRQEVTKPVIVSSPHSQSYSPPASVSRSAPQGYSGGPNIQSVPRSASGPVFAPQPSRASPVYSAPRSQSAPPSSAPRAVTSQPSNSGQRSDRSSVR